eukprot:13909439-Ditylum_brightwellii.AAC.1
MVNSTDYMGYMETNLDTMCGSVTKTIYDNTRKVFNQSKIVSASSSIPVKSYYKPGGIMSITQDNLTAKVVEQESDSWVLTKFAARNSKFITIINAYQPCKVIKKQGVTTYHQQVALLKQDGQNICPKKAFIPDLIKLLESRRKKGELIILGGNFNEVLSTRSFLIKLCTNDQLQLVAILDCPEKRHKSSSLSGKQIIDYMFASPELQPAIRQKGYNRFNQVTHTDHRGMYIDFDMNELFGNGNLKLTNSKSRQAKANDPNM